MEAHGAKAEGFREDVDPRAPGARARTWVEGYADHVRRRHNSRAVISVRVDGVEAVELSQVYALKGGGLVLVVPSGNGDPRGEGTPHGEGHGAHGTAEHPDLDPEDREIWLTSADQAVFELRHARDGEPCTGFGYLGASRTPKVLVPRGTEPPPPVDHHVHGDF